MSGVELGLAIFGTIDQCIKYGKIVVDKWKAFKGADQMIKEQTIIIEAIWLKVSLQLDFLKRIWESLDPNYKDLQERLLVILQSRITGASLQLSKLEKQGPWDSNVPMKKKEALKYALLSRESLNKLISELQNWEKLFDPTWHLTSRMHNQFIDMEFTRHSGAGRLSIEREVRSTLHSPRQASVFLPQRDLDQASRSPIQFSDSHVIDIHAGTEDVSIFMRHVRDLAQKLEKVDARLFHVLKCQGVVRVKDPLTKRVLSFDFIFHIPDGCFEPQSLRSHLYSMTCPSLNEKIELAKQLATSVNYVHVLDIVHKNTRPENALLGNSVWAETTYQHPDRQGIHPSADYTMQHDIYSLGVCLLEIGLWESFVSSQGKIFPQAVNGEDPDPSAYIMEGSSLKDYYVVLANKHLSTKMGEKYMHVVVNCLTCLDETNQDFGDQTEFEDNDGILIGVKYIEKILLLLSEISV
ncbi:hypothetical protein N7495_004688 [Penicillium taxi]|uniref:uncharacterized protein n=1 Tax=Penicillium taxi TaxID=168475 RepID=UPI002545B2AC|nr:uncharacterized protein N7495_004688 [Penicillium taxi]KAJ5899944.1 hypothetical protein N7495_004688 [Penicillium taxi]